METTGKRIQEALDIRHMKQIELARATGMGRGAISQYVSDKVTPKQDKLYLMAKALLVSPAWLMGYDVPMERQPPAPPSSQPPTAPAGPSLTARDERDIERFDPVKAIFDDSDVRSLARDRLKGVSKEEIALKKQQLKAMVAAMWMKEENEK